MNKLEELAEAILATLDKQHTYFRAEWKSPQKAQLLAECKKMEKDLRRTCSEILTNQEKLDVN